MFNYSKLPEHMRAGMKLYVERGIQGGSFMTAVLENDLVRACGKADHINRDYIFEYANFLYNEVPTACWGSPAKVAAWIERGGLHGNEEAA